MQQNTSTKTKPKLSISATILLALSGLLSVAVIIGFTLFYTLEKDRLTLSIHDKSHRVLQSIQAAHTQSMIHRGHIDDNNPVILALNDSLEQLSGSLVSMNIWLIMGPKVVDFQLAQGSNEVEPPQDEVDEEAIATLKPVGRFLSETNYRYTIPVVLGQGAASNPICYTCHGETMGIQEGEPIGGFAASYDATKDIQDFRLFIMESFAYVLVILIVLIFLLFQLLQRLVIKPVSDISSVMTAYTEEDKLFENRIFTQGETLAGLSVNSKELKTMLDALSVFEAQSADITRWIMNSLDKHAIVAVTDEKGSILRVNEKFCDISEYSEDELIGKNHRILNSGYHSDAFFRDMYQTISKGHIWQGEICNHSKNGKEYWVDTTIAPVMDKSGRKPVNYIAIRNDITSLKEAEKASTDARLLAEESAKIKSEFLASMSHEIRTPMNGVLGMLGLLEHSKLDQNQAHQVSLARNSAEALLAVINDILDFSKIEAGKLELEILDFDVRSLLGQTIETLGQKAQDKNLEIILDVSEIERSIVKGDPGRIRQIVTNLVSNAIKFTEQGEVLIRAKLCSEGEGYRFTCSVEDTGIGIPRDKLATLFESFTQVDASTTRKYGGTGLGLAICRQLSELMGGAIRASSEEGRGSRFQFDIALASSADSDKVLPKVDIQGTRIMVVDDNHTNREVLKAQLERWGAIVCEAGSGQEALECMERQLLDKDHPVFPVVFLDMQMPGMDGAELGEKIRADKRYDTSKLIMMTSMSDRGDANFFKEKGFSAYFPKPATTSDLFDALAVLLEGGEALESAKPLVTRHYLKELKRNTESQKAKTYIEQYNWPARSRILLVEDNYVNQTVAKAVLSGYGLACDTAEHGIEALAMLDSSPEDFLYTLVFMDCQMPILDGYETTEKIRQGEAGQRYEDLTIIAMTANAMRGDKEKCIEAGMDDYVSKPIDNDVLLQKLYHWLLSDEAKGTDPNQSKETKETKETEETEELNSSSESQQSEQQAVWDYESFNRRLMGKEAIIRKTVSIFLSDLPQQVERIKQSIQSGDCDEIKHAAHALKGSTSNISANALSSLAQEMEALAISKQASKIPPLLPQLEDAASELIEVLDSYLES